METTVKRHPIRGFFYGIPFGLGLMMIVVGQGWAALGTWPPFIVLIVGIVVSMAWSTFGPAKKPKGAPPVSAAPLTTRQPAARVAPVSEVEAEVAAELKSAGVALDTDEPEPGPEASPTEEADRPEDDPDPSV